MEGNWSAAIVTCPDWHLSIITFILVSSSALLKLERERSIRSEQIYKDNWCTNTGILIKNYNHTFFTFVSKCKTEMHRKKRRRKKKKSHATHCLKLCKQTILKSCWCRPKWASFKKFSIFWDIHISWNFYKKNDAKHLKQLKYQHPSLPWFPLILSY